MRANPEETGRTIKKSGGPYFCIFFSLSLSRGVAQSQGKGEPVVLFGLVPSALHSQGGPDDPRSLNLEARGADTRIACISGAPVIEVGITFFGGWV